MFLSVHERKIDQEVSKEINHFIKELISFYEMTYLHRKIIRIFRDKNKTKIAFP